MPQLAPARSARTPRHPASRPATTPGTGLDPNPATTTYCRSLQAEGVDDRVRASSPLAFVTEDSGAPGQGNRPWVGQSEGLTPALKARAKVPKHVRFLVVAVPLILVVPAGV
ncbi:hypothetical protein Vqi01_47440 [Micromonospora qiuiae]|uniref:Uncharacterized protein n=1 Tax=Micromonospora qiuiae TaxID=502268 RepID=A0ABQ4JGF0_9ACTN|nr:hypothetical protein Vqi01_47440 [Micromonospora qiuiae]